MKITDNKPTLFEKSKSNIWTDPYIQQNLLNEHLNLLSDGASRNGKSIEAIINYIDKHVDNKGHLLDLGCGPGLYAERLVRIRRSVTGVDINTESIRYAQSKSTTVEYIENDYISNFPHGNYNAIIMIYCDMGTHSDNDRNILLQNCYNSLQIGGKLIFDVFNEGIISDKKEGKSWDYYPKANFWSDRPHLLLSQTFHYPSDHSFAYQYNLIEDDEVKHFIIWDRYYEKEEITRILKDTGFKNIRIDENLLDKNDFTSNNQLFIVAEK